MKTAFSLVLKSNDYSGVLSYIKEAGFEGVEPTFHPDGIPSTGNFRKDAKLLKKEADRIGLEIPSMRGGPLFWQTFASESPAEREKAVALARDAMECLHMLGGNVLLIVPGRWEKGQSYLGLFENASQTARKIAPLAEKQKVIVGLENVENKFLVTPYEWCRFIDGIGSPFVRMYLDPGNIFFLNLGEPEDWIEDIGKDRICQVHMKDFVWDEKGMPAMRQLLRGEVNWKGIISRLNEIRYDGWMIAELPLPETGKMEFLKQTKDAINRLLRGET